MIKQKIKKNLSPKIFFLLGMFLFWNIFLVKNVSAFDLSDFEITFDEEFDGSSLNPDNWRLGGVNYIGIHGLAGNQGKNITVDNGLLKIKATKEETVFGGLTYPYTSGEITTIRKFRQKYGYFEARIKYAEDTIGMWPAFWLMPDFGRYGDRDLAYESYLKFNLDNISGPVTSAKLKVMVTDYHLEWWKANVQVHKLLSDGWDEDTVAWNNKPDYDPAWLVQFTGTTQPENTNQIEEGEYLEIDITDYVNQQLAEGKNSVGFALMDEFMRERSVKFGSKESAEEANKPRIIINNTETIYPSDDAYVRDGVYANINYGDESVLQVFDPREDTSHTSEGGMEFDIMETLTVWGPNKTKHAVHWNDGEHKQASSGILNTNPTSDGFHIYGFNWQPGKVEFYIDGAKTWTYENERVGSVPVYILLSHQLGGWSESNCINCDIEDDELPTTMDVDYVRVYQKKTVRADVDQSFVINSTDAMLTLRNSLGLDMSQTNWFSSTTTGDVNCDGTTNSTDAMLILRHSLGLDMNGTGWCE